LNLIDDEIHKDFLECALKENQDERSDLKELLQHAFFDPAFTQNDGSEVKVTGNFDELIKAKV